MLRQEDKSGLALFRRYLAPDKKMQESQPVQQQLALPEVDMYGIAGDLSFVSQQLAWIVGQSNTALKKLADRAHDIARESETTASSAEETSAGVQEIAAQSSVIANASQEALRQCETSAQTAVKNQQDMLHTSAVMLEVVEAVQSSVDAMQELIAASQKIGEFVGKIQGIASQTNLLALNAAIEAARAGEAGRGFAVVADEVRKLASASADTTHEVEETVRNITDKTKKAAESMQKGREKIEVIEKMARQSADGMSDIVNTVQGIQKTVANLCQLSEDQQLTTGQMAIAVENIGNATVEIAGGTQESLQSIALQEKGVAEILEYAQQMNSTVDRIQEVAVHFKRDKELIFGFNPFTAPQSIKDCYVPIVEEVARRAGFTARVIIVSDYDALGRSLLNGTIDLGWFSPFAYVSAKNKGNITPLVTTVVNKQASYVGYIVARKDSGIRTLAELAGRRFAFVDKQSASGYVYPRAMMLQQGKDPERFLGQQLFLGSHNRVIEGVLNGTVDAGGTYSEALDSAGKNGLPVQDIAILAQTDPIPKDAIAARPGMDAHIAEQIKRLFIDITDGGTLAPQMKRTGLNGFISAEDRVYDVIRDVAKLLKV